MYLGRKDKEEEMELMWMNLWRMEQENNLGMNIKDKGLRSWNLRERAERIWEEVIVRIVLRCWSLGIPLVHNATEINMFIRWKYRYRRVTLELNEKVARRGNQWCCCARHVGRKTPTQGIDERIGS